MNIYFDGKPTIEQLGESVRDQVMCGKCKSSTFLVWRGSADGERWRFPFTMYNSQIHGGEYKMSFLVRCSFFRSNIDDPEHIRLCEGFIMTKEPDLPD